MKKIVSGFIALIAVILFDLFRYCVISQSTMDIWKGSSGNLLLPPVALSTLQSLLPEPLLYCGISQKLTV
jgi:hypothetical protein